MGILDGLRVLDISVHLAGPYAAAIMADMGAEVIRIERVGGDDDRRLGYQLSGGDGCMYASRCRNKKSLTLNLLTSGGQEVIRRLVKTSDILIENLGPVTRKAMNIEYQLLKQVNPRLIMASISAYGSWGPNRDKIGFDAIAQAACGAMTFAGFPDDDRPLRSPISWVDYSTALHAAVGIVLALYGREKTGHGQHVDVSMFDTAFNLVGMMGMLTEHCLYGVERAKEGNWSAYVYANAAKAADGWVFISMARDSIWHRFAKAIGRPELTTDSRFNNDLKRFENRRLIDEIVSEWISGKAVVEVISFLEKARVPCQKVNTIHEALAEPQLKARDMIVSVDYPDGKKVPIPGIVAKLSESPGQVKSRAPMLGEHTDEILFNIAAYDRDQIHELRKKGIV